MSMAMGDTSDLLTDRQTMSLVNFWRSRTGMERWMLVLIAVESMALIGFIIGVACLDAEVRSKDTKISQLHHELAKCEAQLTTPDPTSTTSTSSSSISTITGSTPSNTTDAASTTASSSKTTSTSGTSPTTIASTTEPTLTSDYSTNSGTPTLMSTPSSNETTDTTISTDPLTSTSSSSADFSTSAPSNTIPARYQLHQSSHVMKMRLQEVRDPAQRVLYVPKV